MSPSYPGVTFHCALFDIMCISCKLFLVTMITKILESTKYILLTLCPCQHSLARRSMTVKKEQAWTLQQSLTSKSWVETCLRKGHRYFLGGNGLPKRILSPHCFEILAAFQAMMGYWMLTQTTASGFSYKAYCPAVNSMGTGQETRRSYCANKKGSWREQSLTTQRKGWEEISARPRK